MNTSREVGALTIDMNHQVTIDLSVNLNHRWRAFTSVGGRLDQGQGDNYMFCRRIVNSLSVEESKTREST